MTHIVAQWRAPDTDDAIFLEVAAQTGVGAGLLASLRYKPFHNQLAPKRRAKLTPEAAMATR